MQRAGDTAQSGKALPASEETGAMSSAPPRSRLDVLAEEAIACLRQGRADIAAPLVTEMTALLGDRPGIALQMQRAVALVGFEWPATRTAAEVVPTPAPKPDAIEIVAFHVNLESPSRNGFEYGRMVGQLFESARLRAPASRQVLLTDVDAVFPALGPRVKVVRAKVDRSRLMYERMRLQHEHLVDRRAGVATVFLDSDVAVNAEPSPIFSEDFDVGLTYRPLVEAPFNGGVIFVGPGEAGEKFFASALACYEALARSPAIAALYPEDLRAWWGDQFALAALVGWRALAECRGNTLRVEGARVRIFPCETHNHVIEGREYGADELAAKYFIHFKGPRKPMMDLYLQNLRRQDTSYAE
jgi:hypothetical protein